MVESHQPQVSAAVLWAQTARRLHAPESLDGTLQAIVELARSMVEGSDHVGVTRLGRDGGVESPAYSDPLVLLLDQLQGELDQGPCLEAMRSGSVLRIDDMTLDRRWPDFAHHACALGVRSMVSCPVSTGQHSSAALNFHATARAAFDDDSAQIAAVYAAHATLALTNAGLVDSLRHSMDRRQAIGEATGVLMERHRATSRQSFAMLVAASQRLNVKLHAVAVHVVATGQDPQQIQPDHLVG